MIRLGAILVALLFPAAGWAACSTPAGVEGQFYFDGTDYKVCDGTNWSSMAAAAPSGSCTGAGRIEYASSTLRFCNGTNFVSLDGIATDGSCAGFTTGTYRYDATNDWMEWCNGTNWKVMKASAAAPTVTALSQLGAMDDGGVTTTVTGTNFVNGAVVKIDGVNCTTWTFVSATEMTCVVPATTGGRIANVNVTVTNPDTQVGTLTGGFYYLGDPGMWLRSDALVTLASGKVSAWGDSSGNFNSGTTWGAAYRPTYVASSASFNNKPAFTFAGGQVIDIGDAAELPRNAAGISMFVAAKRAATSGGMLLTFQNGADNFKRLGLAVKDTYSATNVGGSTGDFVLLGRRQEADPLNYIAGGTLATNATFVGSSVINFPTRTAAIYVNGTSVASSSTFSTGGGNTDDVDSVNSIVGGDDDYDQFIGDIAEVFFYRIAMTNAQRQVVEGYLKKKYNTP